MTIGAQFYKLTKPLEKNGKLLHTENVKQHSFAKIGIDAWGQPAILIDSTKRIAALKRNYRLKYIEFNHHAACTVKTGADVVSGTYLLIVFRCTDQKLNEYFFGIIATFLDALAAATMDSELGEAFKNLIEIFRSLNEPPVSTVQGLWAELFFIASARSPQVLLSCWHDNPQNKFDFEAGLDKLEMKSTRNTSRVHTFSAEQLNADNAFNILVGSIFVIESSAGKSIKTLLSQIEPNIFDPSLLFKLKMMVARTLGTALETSVNMCFDNTVAKESLRFYERAEIDKIERKDIPSRISEVHFKSDLSFARSIQPIELNPGSDLFQAI